MIPYAKHTITGDDIRAVSEVMRSGRLTQGPIAEEFEDQLANYLGVEHVVACSSGSMALLLAYEAAGLYRARTTIVPAISHVSTASMALALGRYVSFSDVSPVNGLMRGVDTGAQKIGKLAVTAVTHMAGVLAEPPALSGRECVVVADGAHALGAPGVCHINGIDLTTFSFHPSKTITAGEGGAIATNSLAFAVKIRRMRDHGVSGRVPGGYEVSETGWNGRMNEMSAALGLSQLQRIDEIVNARALICGWYEQRLNIPGNTWTHGGSFNLLRVRVDWREFGARRQEVMRRMACDGIETQVHYIPLTMHDAFIGPTPAGALAYYKQTLTLPLWPGMREGDADRVCASLEKALGLR